MTNIQLIICNVIMEDIGPFKKEFMQNVLKKILLMEDHQELLLPVNSPPIFAGSVLADSSTNPAKIGQFYRCIG